MTLSNSGNTPLQRLISIIFDHLISLIVILKSMQNLRDQKVGYRVIAEEVKNKFGRKISFQQVHKILNREHNQKLLAA